jgi:subtilisin family serine protease
MMARYVLSHRRAGLFRDPEKRAARDEAHRAMSLLAPVADIVGAQSPPEDTAREIVVFEASPTEVAARRSELGPDVILEPEILHFPSVALPLDLRGAALRRTAGPALAGAGRTLALTVRGPSGALPGAEVLIFLRSPGGLSNSLRTRTDERGEARFEYGETWAPAALLAIPAGGHWTMVVRGPTDGITVEAPELPATGARAWWHELLGVADPGAGAGIRVGVADTGVGPHPHLGHATDTGAFIDGRHDTEERAGQDVDAHGTHVCGTIGGRPEDPCGYAGGVAPGSELFSARVFPSADQGANQGDIAAAIDHLSADRAADLINLSLGAPRGSRIERDAIIDALERGTLCVCAAANSSGPVEFPAAFPEAVAVSALGREGWAPDGSLSATRYPDQPDRYGDDGLFLANFSCFGPEIVCGAPGVGIIATVPERFGLGAPYAAMDGTSMASPAACGLLAAVLGAAPDYGTLPRDLTRSARARALLRSACRDIGLDARFQGHGVPTHPA